MKEKKLPVPTPGYSRAAESLAYIIRFKPGAQNGWADSQEVKPSSDYLARVLEDHDPDYGLDQDRFYEGRWVRSLCVNPYGIKGSNGNGKAPSRLIHSIGKYADSIFPPLIGTTTQTTLDEMNRVATEDNTPPAETLERIEAHYGVLMNAVAMALKNATDPTERLNWMIVQSTYQNLVATLAIRVSPSSPSLTPKIRSAIQLSRSIRDVAMDPDNKIPLSPVVQGSLFKMLGNELWFAVQDPGVDLAAVSRKAENAGFWDLSRQHQALLKLPRRAKPEAWYVGTPMQALTIASVLKDGKLAFEFGKALVEADKGFLSPDYKKFAGDSSLNEEPLLSFYLKKVHPRVRGES